MTFTSDYIRQLVVSPSIQRSGTVGLILELDSPGFDIATKTNNCNSNNPISPTNRTILNTTQPGNVFKREATDQEPTLLELEAKFGS